MRTIELKSRLVRLTSRRARTARENAERPSAWYPSGTFSTSAIVGATSSVRASASLTRPRLCPGFFTNSGTGASSSTFVRLMLRRVGTPTCHAKPWSAVTTISVSSYIPWLFSRATSRPSRRSTYPSWSR
jgi:hypothetical protein